MAKPKINFYCQECGNHLPKWMGQCSYCKSWNTVVEELVQKEIVSRSTLDLPSHKIIQLKDIPSTDHERLDVNDSELNRVLGGGLVPGSVILVSGEPGIGKSTLFLQVGLLLRGSIVLYISGEESAQQIKMRADRIGQASDTFYLLTETDTSVLFSEIKKIKPDVIIIDSIQTLNSPYIESGAGSVSQVKECTAEIIRYAKATNTSVFIIGHINKDGMVAGPKVLEHMVDAVLNFEGDRQHVYRILRAQKNRFGSSHELGIYEMLHHGLRPVANPSEILIDSKNEQLSGSAVAATIEGIRPFLVETQALVTTSVYGTPQRTVNGYDTRKLQLILAVLEKRGGFHFGSKDVFLNIAGGIKIEDPAMDMAIATALLSSYHDIVIPHDIVFAGEVGLNGEVRTVTKIDQRVAEADKMGFSKIFIPAQNQKGLTKQARNIEILPIATVEELYQRLF
jgi:DNA repair protein RadA/Sms